jgi:hypothetical protein
MEQDEHFRLMDAHRKRRAVDFIPYWCRPSEGTCTYTDHGDRVTVALEVSGLGKVFISADATYTRSTGLRWNENHHLTSSIQAVP